MVATPMLEETAVGPAPIVGIPWTRSPPIVRLPSASRARPVRRPRAPAPAVPLFPDAPALFPWLARRFAPGEGTLWAGPPRVVEALLRDVFAGAVAAGGRVSLLE